MTRFHDFRFPAESDAYRQARDELLAAEIELRRQIAAVAKKRQALPDGGVLAENLVAANGIPWQRLQRVC